MNNMKIRNIFLHPLNNRSKTLLCFQIFSESINLSSLIVLISTKLSLSQPFTLISCTNNQSLQPEIDLLPYLQNNSAFYISYGQRGLLGGKGGFGALMRGQAGTKRKITNWDASRDLQGRRIRNLNNQSRLTEFVRNRKREEKKMEKEIEEWKKVEIEQKATQREVKLDVGYKQKVESAGKKVQESLQLSRTGSISVSTVSEDESERDRNTRRIEMLKQVKDALKVQKKQQCQQQQKPEFMDEEENKEQTQKGKEPEEKLEQLGLEMMISSKKQKKRIEKEKQKLLKQEIQLIKEEIKNEFDIVDLEKVNNFEELKELGNENLKFQLERLGVKSGGTLEQKAERLFKIKLNPMNVLNPAFQAKKIV